MATTTTPERPAAMPAEGNGLAPRPHCKACGKPLKPHRRQTERDATPEEIAHERAARDEYEAERAAIRHAYDRNELTTTEYERRESRSPRRYEQRRHHAPGVTVYWMPNSSTPTRAHVNVRDGWGNYGDNEFCGQGCAYTWAIAIRNAVKSGRLAIVAGPKARTREASR